MLRVPALAAAMVLTATLAGIAIHQTTSPTVPIDPANPVNCQALGCPGSPPEPTITTSTPPPEPTPTTTTPPAARFTG